MFIINLFKKIYNFILGLFGIRKEDGNVTEEPKQEDPETNYDECDGLEIRRDGSFVKDDGTTFIQFVAVKKK